MDNIERKYLTGREYAALLSMFAQVSHYMVLLPTLEKRAKMIPGVWESLTEAQRLTDDALNKIPKTIPENKLRHVLADVQNAKIYVKIEPPGCVPSVDMTGFSYVPTKALNDLLMYVMDHECLLCDKTPGEAKKCPVREMFDAALPHEVVAKDTNMCRYSDMSLGLGVDTE